MHQKRRFLKTEATVGGRRSKLDGPPSDIGFKGARREVPSITTEILEEDEQAFADYDDASVVKINKQGRHIKRKGTVPTVSQSTNMNFRGANILSSNQAALAKLRKKSMVQNP